MNNTTKLLKAIDSLLPEYLSDPLDVKNNDGCWAICIIDADNNITGKLGGNDKILVRQIYKIAWTKASQVWITGFKTREFEQLVYSGKIDSHAFGINDPDFIGWEGGQPIVLKDGTKLSVGFSGFRGTSDVEIVQRALKLAGI